MPEIILTDNNFESEVLNSDVPVFVDFWAPWCGPCQMMVSIISELSAEYGVEKVKIAKMNIDENQIIPGRYQVMSIPTFILFKGGKVNGQTIGGVSKEKLKEMIDQNI